MKSMDTNDINWHDLMSIDLDVLGNQLNTNHSLVTQLASYLTSLSMDKQFDLQKLDENVAKFMLTLQMIVKNLLKLNINPNEDMKNNNIVISNNQLSRENKKLRKLLEIHQKAMTYNQTVSGEYSGEYVQCPHCPKVFFDTNYLKTHFARRHPNDSLDSEGMLALTKKIDKYQTEVFGDNKQLKQLTNEIKVLNEQLTKTEIRLQQERDERLKLEEHINYVLKVRDKELQQMMKEELEDIKFVKTERDVIQHYSNSKDQSNDNTDDSNEQTSSKSLDVMKIEEIFAIQAKEMIKLDIMKKVIEERQLAIQQNRFDFNYEAIEQHIRNFIEKKVDEKMGLDVKENDISIENERSHETLLLKDMTKQNHITVEKSLVEAEVHTSPLIETKLSIKDQNVVQKIEISENKTKTINDSLNDTIKQRLSETNNIPKSVLKSIISNKKLEENNDKSKERHIRFSDHHIEHQISPEDSSSEDDYSIVISDSIIAPNISYDDSSQSSTAPIPARRTQKSNLSLDFKSPFSMTSDEDMINDSIYKINDQLMNEILHTNESNNESDSQSLKNKSTLNEEIKVDSQQTRVHELAEMIEKQLNKRSENNRKPPVGSVNVVTGQHVSNKQQILNYNRLDSDSESD
ncbi:cilium assembly protein DZIP1-like [Oppia nitens]|uniref:cilium assembly protein DZIP1-like n=1 Tax=Oppia nitens TaxID=1686743 RepID=UPI0023DB4B9A|nr:cilium assembly protein DZIP1-like [Oppia nitens]